MAEYPREFPLLTSPNIASFDFFDLASGTAYKKFYASATSATNAGTKYFLTTQVNAGGTGALTIESGSSELNFDTSVFTTPLTVEGECMIHVPNSVINDTGSSQTQTAVITVVVYHVDKASTETSLGTDFYTHTATSLGVGATSYSDALFKITLQKKQIAVGEKLRLSVTSNQTAGAGDHTLYFDALNTTTGSLVSSQLTMDIPFFVG